MSHALRATSPPVASTTFATEDDETTTIRFALFETKRVRARARDASSAEHRASDGFVREDHACYVGGSVWALDWHSSERVFAVAARGEGHHAHAARAAGTCRGDVGAQIWRVRDEGGPEMEVMLLGNGGCVTDARWAPEVRSVDEDGDGDGDGALGRLAVSLGDSRVEVWTVPRWSPSTPRTRRANVSFAGIVPEDYGAPLCVDWNAAVPGRLAAGYSSGRVCVWDVDADDARGTAPTYPKFVITAAAQSGPCRVVRWPPLEHPEDASVCANVFAAGADNAAKPHVLDLRAPFAPLGDVFERGAPWILDMAWLPRGSLVAGMETSDRSSAKSLRSATSAAAASKSLIQQFDLVADADDDGAQPTSTYQMPGRGAPWGIDARASSNPRCAAAMVACASSNGVVAVSPLRFVGKRLRAASRPAFEPCAGLRASDDETNATTTRANPVDPPTRFEFIVPGADDASAREDAFPRGAAAAPGSRDAPTTAQHRARWSRAPSDEWWLASAGEAGFVRVQRFDATWAERRLEQLERLHAPAAARNKESEEKNGL